VAAWVGAVRQTRPVPTRSWLLAPILLIQLLLGLALHNTISGDEAVYTTAGHAVIAHWLHGTPLPNFGSYFSGSVSLYPVLSAVLERIGGIFVQRAFSTVCMLAVTTLLFLTARRIVGPAAALMGALLFATYAPTLFLSRLATFDAPSLLLLAIAIYLCVRAAQSDNPWPLLAVGPLLALAYATKYVTIEFDPVVIAFLIAVAAVEQSRRRTAILTVTALGSAVLSGVVCLLLLTNTDFRGIANTSSPSRHVLHPASYQTMAWLFVRHGGVLFALAVLGAWLTPRRYRWVAGVGLIGLVTPVVTQSLIHESTSIFKHMAFGLFFSAPYAGLAVSTMLQRGRAHALRSAVAAAVLVYCLIAGQLLIRGTFDYGWPNATKTVAYLRTQVTGKGRYFAEDNLVYAYYLANHTNVNQWASTYSYFYFTPAHLLSGKDAMLAAIRARRFQLVVLEDDVTRSLDQQLIPTLKRYYHVTFRDGYAHGSREWTVWKPDAVPVGGTG
jgi:4-amino-4-deoxy-L-arabinose transferase-like glycosyltransferase